MSDSNDKLAVLAVELLHGESLKNLKKVGSFNSKNLNHLPEHIRNKFTKEGVKYADIYRQLYTEMYLKHLSKDELEALIKFHGSEVGRSIASAQIQIEREVSARINDIKNSRTKTETQGNLKVITKDIFTKD